MNASRTTLLSACTLVPVGLAAIAAASPSLLGGLFFLPQVGSDANSVENGFIQPADDALSGGGRDQSLQFGDNIFGTTRSDFLQGRLGTDILVGDNGDDVLMGGTEHFNPTNRDRAFGGAGRDVFLWAPGDGSDFFDGGPGFDTVVLGLAGEVVDGDVVFQVTTDQLAGDVFLDPVTNLPQIDVTNSPGFCNIVDDSDAGDAAAQLDALGLDNIVQFIIRAAADSFEAGEQDTDNGLRVSLHLRNVEAVVCATREGGAIEAFDLRTTPPTPIALEDILVDSVQAIVR